jgi:hypothetical protein
MKRANTIGAYMLYVVGIAIGLTWFDITAPIVVIVAGPLVGALLWRKRWGGEVLGGVLGGVVSYVGFFLGWYAWSSFRNGPEPDLLGLVIGSIASPFAGAVVGAYVGMLVFLAAEIVRARRNRGFVSVQADSPKAVGPESPSSDDGVSSAAEGA